MKRSDLRPGMEVAWGKPDSYSGARRAIVLGEQLFSGRVLVAYRRRYGNDHGWILGTTAPDRYSRYGTAGVPCAVHQAAYMGVDGPVPEHWTFEPVPAREIWGLWEDYETVRAEHLAKERQAAAARTASAKAQREWGQDMSERLEALGLVGSVSYDYRRVTFSGDDLERLLDLAAKELGNG